MVWVTRNGTKMQIPRKLSHHIPSMPIWSTDAFQEKVPQFCSTNGWFKGLSYNTAIPRRGKSLTTSTQRISNFTSELWRRSTSCRSPSWSTSLWSPCLSQAPSWSTSLWLHCVWQAPAPWEIVGKPKFKMGRRASHLPTQVGLGWSGLFCLGNWLLKEIWPKDKWWKE